MLKVILPGGEEIVIPRAVDACADGEAAQVYIDTYVARRVAGDNPGQAHRVARDTAVAEFPAADQALVDAIVNARSGDEASAAAAAMVAARTLSRDRVLEKRSQLGGAS